MAIQKSLGVGKIYVKRSNVVQFQVVSLGELGLVLNHFKKFRLITQKHTDFKFLDEIYVMMLNKEHLTPEGLIKIVAIKASMNIGLSEKLKVAFPDVVP